MSKPSHKQQLRKIRKNKERHKDRILQKEGDRLHSDRMLKKADKEFADAQVKEKKLFIRLVRQLIKIKVNIFNIFKNLFKKQHAIQQT